QTRDGRSKARDPIPLSKLQTPRTQQQSQSAMIVRQARVTTRLPESMRSARSPLTSYPRTHCPIGLSPPPAPARSRFRCHTLHTYGDASTVKTKRLHRIVL